MAPGRFKKTHGLFDGVLNFFGIQTDEQKQQQKQLEQQQKDQQAELEAQQKKQEILNQKQREYERKQKLQAGKLPTPGIRGVGGM